MERKNDMEIRKGNSAYVYLNLRRRNRMRQQIFKYIIQDNISDIKINTHIDNTHRHTQL